MFDHITNKVVDESNVVPTEPSVPKRLSYIMPIFASKGDREINEIDRPSKAKSVYGTDVDDFDKYGQAGLNLIAGLNGGATVFACRLLPSDAKRAAIAISIQTMPTTGIPQYKRTASGGFELDGSGQKVPLLDAGNQAVVADGFNIRILTQLVADPDNYDAGVTDSAGWKNYPIMMLKYFTDGKCGNDSGIQIGVDKTRDRKVTDGRRYYLKMFERSLEGSVNPIDDEYYFSFNKDAKDPSNSTLREYLGVVFPSKLTDGSKCPMVLAHYSDNLTALLTELQAAIPGVALYDIDPIFGLNKSGYAYDRVIVDPTSIDVESSVVFLKGGTDGSLQLGNVVTGTNGTPVTVDKNVIAATKKQLLIKFWNCDYNDDLLDRRIVPAAYALDCIDYDNDIKTAMDALHEYREDIVTFLGYAAKNEQQAITMLSQIQSTINGSKAWNLVIVPHAGVTTNLTDNKYVLATYEIARGLPETYGEFGRFANYAGYKAGKIKYMKFDWTAKLRKNDILQQLEDAALMYAQVLDRDGTTAFMNARNQYNAPYSKMKLWRNAAIVGDAERSANAILIKYKWDPAGATRSIGDAQKELISYFAEKAYPDSVVVKTNVFQSKRDKQTENASCELIFYFPGEVGGWNITIRARREEDLAGGN